MPSSFLPKVRTPFLRCGNVVTDEEFLKEWEIREQGQVERKRKMMEKIQKQTEEGSLFRKQKREKYPPKKRRKVWEPSESETDFELSSGDVSIDEESDKDMDKEEKEKKKRKRKDRISKEKEKPAGIASDTSETLEDLETEYDEDGQEPVEIDIADMDDVFPLSPEEVEKVKKKIATALPVLEKRKCKPVYRFDLQDYEGRKRVKRS
jgi:hypothetical protein